MIKRVTKFVVILLTGLFLVTVLSCPYAMAQTASSGATNTAAASGQSRGFSLTAKSAQSFLKEKNMIVGTSWTEDGDKYDCYTDNWLHEGDETKYYCIRSDSKKDGKYAEDASLYTRSGDDKGCPVVAVEWHNSQDCKFCSLLSIAYRASDEITSKSFKLFSHSFAVLIVIVFVIWLAIKTLGYVSMLAAQDAAKYLTDLLIQAFKFLLAFFALYNYQELYDLFIIPLLTSGLQFADKFVDSGMSAADYKLFAEEGGKYVRSSMEIVRANKLYDVKTYSMIEKFTLDVNMQFSLLQTTGQALRCLSGRYLFSGFSEVHEGSRFGLGLGCFLYGAMFGTLGFLLSMSFVFYLFDAVVQLGIFGALIPFAVACWPFKMFTKSANNAFKIFMNTVFTFMMAGVVVKVCVQLLSCALTNLGSGRYDNTAMLVQAIDTLDSSALHVIVGEINVKVLVFAFACLSGFLLVGKVGELTDRFAKGGLSPIAPGLATVAASGVKGVAQKVAGPTLNRLQGDFNTMVGGAIKGAGRASEKVVRGVPKAIGGLVRKMRGRGT